MRTILVLLTSGSLALMPGPGTPQTAAAQVGADSAQQALNSISRELDSQRVEEAEVICHPFRHFVQK
jgi:hypothetical protein